MPTLTRLKRDSDVTRGKGPPLASVSNGDGAPTGPEMEFEDDGSYQTPVAKDGFFSYISPAVLAAACASAFAVALICVLALLWFRARRRRQKLLHDLTFDDGSEESRSTKSAPASRSPSPKLNKRMSCPDALSIKPKGMLFRSMTTDRVPDFTLPPERVQPWSPQDKKNSLVNFSNHQRNSSIGSIKPDLYHHQSFSEDDEPNLPETPYGRLWFSLVYDAAVETLQVTLNKVKDLPGRNNLQPRDPFVKIYLLPDERTCRVSKVKKKTLSPIFNETHLFQVSEEDIRKRVLRFSVYDVDRRRVRHSLGHVMINLKGIDLTKGDVMWSDLEPMVQASSSLGEVQFSMVYMPYNEKIKIGIHHAKNLNYIEDYPNMGAYVRVQLYYGHKCHRIKRTITRPGGADMLFNESLSFTVHGKQLDSCNMVVSVMLTSPRAYGSNDVEYGRVVIGPFMYSRGEELMHWQEMLSQPRTSITQWHALTRNASSSP